VMLEAGLSGAPILAADLEGIRDVVSEGGSGHLLPARDAEAFARAIRRYRDDRDALRALSRSAARSTAERFAWPVVVDTLLDTFRAAHLETGKTGGR
ncbi:MAG TPA: glycosyltransferase, partial [Longimicrobiaceae bacterium]|nr:glycosyltransferase [Longimicrobiaceae bacterium]